ncbi:MAG: MoaD/ThiS family protein [Oscillospiraceae bacterium]|nr:MoaD/ThiS family protein [Oscillospiraceae bacterium]
MQITVQTGSWARAYLTREQSASETFALELSEGSSVADLLELLPIPADEMGLVAINGRAVLRSAALSDGDAVRVFPTVMGG